MIRDLASTILASVIVATVASTYVTGLFLIEIADAFIEGRMGELWKRSLRNL